MLTLIFLLAIESIQNILAHTDLKNVAQNQLFQFILKRVYGNVEIINRSFVNMQQQQQSKIFAVMLLLSTC